MSDLVLSITVQELCHCEGLTQELIIEVVEHDIAKPLEGENIVDWVFDTSSARWIQKAARLHHDLEIDWIAVGMVIDLLQKNESLQRHNQSIEQQLKRFVTL